jgi:hypothetical protein
MLFNIHGPWTITLYSLFIFPPISIRHRSSTHRHLHFYYVSMPSRLSRTPALPSLARSTPPRRHCSFLPWVIDHPSSPSPRLRGLKSTRHLDFRVEQSGLKLEPSGRHPTRPRTSYLRHLVVPRGSHLVNDIHSRRSRSLAPRDPSTPCTGRRRQPLDCRFRYLSRHVSIHRQFLLDFVYPVAL